METLVSREARRRTAQHHVRMLRRNKVFCSSMIRRTMLTTVNRAPITVGPTAYTTLGSSTFTAPQTGVYTFGCQAHASGGGAGRLSQRGGGGGGGGYSVVTITMNAGDQVTFLNVAGGAGGVSATSAGVAPDVTGVCTVTQSSTVICQANPGLGGKGGATGVPGAAGAGGTTTGAVGDTTTAGNTGSTGTGGNAINGGTGGTQGNPGGTGGIGAGGGAGTTSGNAGGPGGQSEIWVTYTY